MAMSCNQRDASRVGSLTTTATGRSENVGPPQMLPNESERACEALKCHVRRAAARGERTRLGSRAKLDAGAHEAESMGTLGAVQVQVHMAVSGQWRSGPEARQSSDGEHALHRPAAASSAREDSGRRSARAAATVATSRASAFCCNVGGVKA